MKKRETKGLYSFIKQTKDECDFCGKIIESKDEITVGYHFECKKKHDLQINLRALEHFEELRDWIEDHRSRVFLDNLKTDPNNFLLSEKVTPEILATATKMSFSYDGTSNYERIYEYPESFGELISIRKISGQVDVLPYNIGNLINLEEIDITGGEEDIKLPKSIAQLQYLKTLKIQWGDLSDFSGQLPSVENFIFIERIYDGEERPVPEFITNIRRYLPNLKHVDIKREY